MPLSCMKVHLVAHCLPDSDSSPGQRHMAKHAQHHQRQLSVAAQHIELAVIFNPLNIGAPPTGHLVQS